MCSESIWQVSNTEESNGGYPEQDDIGGRYREVGSHREVEE